MSSGTHAEHVRDALQASCLFARLGKVKPNCQAILTARKGKGWTQLELAEAAGIALRVVQDAENEKLVRRGRRFQRNSLACIAGALGLELADIVVPEFRPTTAPPAQWLIRALDRGREKCRIRNQRFFTAHLLLTLLDIPDGAARHCFHQTGIGGSIIGELEGRLAKMFPESDEIRFRDFDWSDRTDFLTALELARGDGRATDKHLLQAILSGGSKTVEWLARRLGTSEFEQLQDAVDDYPGDKPPGWSSARTAGFSSMTQDGEPPSSA